MFKNILLSILLSLIPFVFFGQQQAISTVKGVLDVPPTITATGHQMYCPQTHLNIVTDVQITDPDNTGAPAVYIQITNGYVNGQDILTLNGTHPNILTQWNATEGKLKLYGIGNAEVLYTDFISALKDVIFYNSSTNPSGIRDFSITIGLANYLPSNGHYYVYYPQVGISWTDAKIAAEGTTYYGLQGYLATITSSDEAQLAGAQAAGAGWIGGSDASTEGIWKWMTGPEVGNNFTYTYWNTGEPNNQNDEDYAHVTAPGIGILGSWNDLKNAGDPSGDYQPKGYIVEFGGMPNDPILQIAASSRMVIPEINATVSVSACGQSSVTLEATASIGIIYWYDSPTGGTIIGSGNTFTTPTLSTPTTYYAQAECNKSRVPITADVHLIPTIDAIDADQSLCGQGNVTLHAHSNDGIIYWYDAANATNTIGTGDSITINNVTETTIFYAEAINSGCTNGNRSSINVNVYPLPEVNDEKVVLCENKPMILDAETSGCTYLWNDHSTNATLEIFIPGNYFVEITNQHGCSQTKHFQVISHLNSEIVNVDVNNSDVQINVKIPQDYYLYSIDGNVYQNSPIFTVLEGGQYTAYVTDTEHCFIATAPFFVLKIPNYFTPNGDGFHDTFEIRDLNLYANASIRIFNRFGKLLAQYNASDTGWDGTYLGNPLPASDYWYVVELNSGEKIIKGHFTLKR